MLLKNCSLKLFKYWFAGYIIGVLLAVALITVQNSRFLWGDSNNETDEEAELRRILQYYRDNWILDDEIVNWTYWVPWPPIIHGIDYLMHVNKGEDRTVANDIAEVVSVFCLVMTKANHHTNRSQLIKDTWGSRCNKLVFMSNEADKDLPAIALSTGEDDPWGRDKEAFHYVYHHHRNEADWFLRTDDNTYIIMENLKYMLKNYSSAKAMYFGYMPDENDSSENDLSLSLDAGYVFSKAALERFVNRSRQECNSTSVSKYYQMEDCLRKINVNIVNTTDSAGHARFFPYNPTKLKKSSTGASDFAISFYNITYNYIYVMEYIMYHLRPFGIVAKYTYTAPESNP